MLRSEVTGTDGLSMSLQRLRVDAEHRLSARAGAVISAKEVNS
jgi:hypothetical protein